MEPESPPPTDRSDNADLARAENIVSAAGERLLVERLHRVLDEGGITAHTAFCESMLPYLQGLVLLLPRLVHEGARQDAVEAVHLLNKAVQENGADLQDAISEGIGLHEALEQKIVAQIRDRDRPLVTALNQFGGLLLESTRQILPRAAAPGEPAAVPVGRTDAETGLHTHEFFEERFGEEILRAQRSEKALALVLLHVDGLPPGSDNSGISTVGALRRVTTAMLSQTRGFDLATRLSDEKFALLLPETDRAGALAIITRLARGSAESPYLKPTLHFRAGVAVYPLDGKTAHELIQHADGMLQGEGQPSQL